MKIINFSLPVSNLGQGSVDKKIWSVYSIAFDNKETV
jgi:hypothetical protein